MILIDSVYDLPDMDKGPYYVSSFLLRMLWLLLFSKHQPRQGFSTSALLTFWIIKSFTVGKVRCVLCIAASLVLYLLDANSHLPNHDMENVFTY